MFYYYIIIVTLWEYSFILSGILGKPDEYKPNIPSPFTSVLASPNWKISHSLPTTLYVYLPYLMLCSHKLVTYIVYRLFGAVRVA